MTGSGYDVPARCSTRLAATAVSVTLTRAFPVALAQQTQRLSKVSIDDFKSVSDHNIQLVPSLGDDRDFYSADQDFDYPTRNTFQATAAVRTGGIQTWWGA